MQLKSGINQHITLDRDVLETVFEAFARNLSDTFGIEFTGMREKLLLFPEMKTIILIIHNLHTLEEGLLFGSDSRRIYLRWTLDLVLIKVISSKLITYNRFSFKLCLIDHCDVMFQNVE